MNQLQPWLLYKTDQGIPQLLYKALQQGQFREVTDKQKHDSWNFYWKACGFTHSDYKNVKSWQVLNHFPKANTITRKDSLARCLKRMRMVYGTVYNFFPVSFNLPNDYTKFLSYFTKLQSKFKGKQVWICKPSDLSRGRGIFLFHCISELLYDGPTVVQRYIDDPYLIGGYKFDLRLYVVVTSYHPLRIYIHQDGLVRFSTEKYSGSLLHNVYAHLTNTSINKSGPNYNSDKERIGAGCKWSISQLRAYFQQCSVDDRLAWERIKHMITLTVLMQVNAVPESAKQCVELYGFDIILDAKLKPWLLEVNFTPALGNDCSADVAVKQPMLVDLLSLAKHKMNLPRPSTEIMRCRPRTNFRHVQEQEDLYITGNFSRLNVWGNNGRLHFCYNCTMNTNVPKRNENEFDDVFRNRFIMSPSETEHMKNIEKRFIRIPDIKKTKSIIEQNSPSLRTVSSVSTKSASGPAPMGTPMSSVKKVRSKSSTTKSYRTSTQANSVLISEYKVGGFYLTYPISNSQSHHSQGNMDVGKAVSEIRNTLRIAETNFKFLPPERRQLYETMYIKWNALSGFKNAL